MATRDEIAFGQEFLDSIVEFVKNYLEPDEVFTDAQLQEWAENNGYVEEQDE